MGRTRLQLTEADKDARIELNRERSRQRYARLKGTIEVSDDARKKQNEYQKNRLESIPGAKEANQKNAKERHERLKNDPAYKLDKLQRTKKWALDHPGENAYNFNFYRAKRLNRIPSFFDKGKVLAFYLEAERLRKETGLNYEVDHIVPLKSKVVS